MDNRSSFISYTDIPYKTKPTFGEVGWVETLIKWGMLTHKDIPEFSFALLGQIRKDLKEAGRSQEEIESTIAGLSELPEYETSNRNAQSRS